MTKEQEELIKRVFKEGEYSSLKMAVSLESKDRLLDYLRDAPFALVVVYSEDQGNNFLHMYILNKDLTKFQNYLEASGLKVKIPSHVQAAMDFENPDLEGTRQ